MASKTYRADTVDKKNVLYVREKEQGRRPMGLAAKKQYRLYKGDAEWLAANWKNANDFVRNSVHAAIENVHTELTNT
jgi:hypothetical protein